MKFSHSRAHKVMWGFLAIAALLAGIVAYSFIKTMFVERDFWEKVQHRLVVEGEKVPAKRGHILSDEGQLLAANVPSYSLYMDFVVVDKNPQRQEIIQNMRDSIFLLQVDSLCVGMAKIVPDVDPVRLERQLRAAHQKKARHFPLHKKRINYEQFRAITRLPFFQYYKGKVCPAHQEYLSRRAVYKKEIKLMGLHYDEYNTRIRPYDKLARRTIGAFHPEKDSARYGLELGLDSLLRGVDGERRVEQIRSSRMPFITKAPIDGYDVRTTLNVKMQDIMEKMIGEQVREIRADYGIGVLMEVKTGDVKAMTTLRRDPKDNTCYEGENLAVSQLMEPGSVFKSVSFLVALNDGKITPETTLDVGDGIKKMYGRTMRDANWRSGGSGVMTVPQMLEHSSNVGVSSLIDRAYASNPQAFIKGVLQTGIAEDFHLPLPGYAVPKIPHPKMKGYYWSKTSLPWMSIGYVTQIPPLASVAFYNGVANNGRFMRPRFVTAKMKEGQVIEEYPPVVVREQMAKPQAIADLQHMLAGVVTKGYGKKAASRYFSVAGKTGTAQVWTKDGRSSKYLVSFVGYFPAEKPLYSMIVSMVYDGVGASGGGMCAPVFKRIAESVMAQRKNTHYDQAKDTLCALMPTLSSGNLVRTYSLLTALQLPVSMMSGAMRGGVVWGRAEHKNNEYHLSSEEIADKTMPQLLGYGLRDAVYRLESLGLRVRVKGTGRVVAQSLPAGSAYREGEVVMLELGQGKRNHSEEGDFDTATDAVRPTSATPREERSTAAITPAVVAVKQAPASAEKSVERKPSAPRVVTTTASSSKTTGAKHGSTPAESAKTKAAPTSARAVGTNHHATGEKKQAATHKKSSVTKEKKAQTAASSPTSSKKQAAAVKKHDTTSKTLPTASKKQAGVTPKQATATKKRTGTSPKRAAATKKQVATAHTSAKKENQQAKKSSASAAKKKKQEGGRSRAA